MEITRRGQEEYAEETEEDSLATARSCAEYTTTGRQLYKRTVC